MATWLAFACALIGILIGAKPAQAVTGLTATPVTWDIVGLDSNDVTSGPNEFLVGARVCNTGVVGDPPATNVTATLVWDSANPNINVTAGRPTTVTVGTGTLTAGQCHDAYFSIDVTRTAAAYNTARRYHIQVTADNGLTASTPTPRELFVEKLISQQRNSVDSISGPATVYVGQTVTYTVQSSTAPQGYQQLEAVTYFNNLVFRIDKIDTTYTAPAGAVNDKIYADACGWDPNPLSATYRSCIGPTNYSGGKAGGTVVTTYTVTIMSPGPATIQTLITDFSGSSFHYNQDVGLNSLAVTAFPAADLSMDKSVSQPAGDPYIVGQPLQYALTVANAGPSPATAAVATDTLPLGVNYGTGDSGCTYDVPTRTVTCALGDMAVGDVVTKHFTVTPTVTGSLTNTASASSSTTDLVPGNNSDSATVTIVPAADLSITKAVLSPAAAPYYNGDPLTYRLSVHNAGPSTAAAPVVTDTLPAGLSFVSAPAGCSFSSPTISCTLADLASDGTASVDIVVQPTVSGSVTNLAAVSSTTIDLDSSNNSTTATTTILPVADLGIIKSVDNAAPDVGDTVEFTLTILNLGPDIAANVLVSDLLPAGLQYVADDGLGAYIPGTGGWTVGALGVGSSATLHITSQVTTANAVTNTATVSSTTHDALSGNNTATVDVDALDADLEVVKSADDSAPNLGGPVTYTVTVTNSGPDDATGVEVSDQLPAGVTYVSDDGSGAYDPGSGVWTIGDLANGATATLDITGTVSTVNIVTNTASVSASTFDPTSANDDASVDVDARAADLAVSKTVDDPTPDVGGQVTYSVTVTNNGPDDATGVQVTDQLPAGVMYVSDDGAGAYDSATGVWTVGNLANGASATLNVTVAVDDHTVVTNTAVVSSTSVDPTSANDSASVGVDALDADLAVSKSVDDPTPSLGGQVVYTVTVTNNGPDDATGVEVADQLPAGVTYVSDDAGGAYDSATGVWTVGNLANGATATLQITATVTTVSVVSNTATVATSTFDPASGNDLASVDVDARAADLAVTKTVDDATPDVGGQVVYSVTVTNNGPDDATGVEVTDQLPAGVIYVSDDSSGAYDSGTGVWTIGNLANGATATMDVTVTVDDHTLVSNTASVLSTSTDTDGSNDSATVDVDALDADLAVSKSVDDATPNLGGQVVYTVTVTNNGPDNASGVTVADQLPAGVTYLSDDAGGAYDSATGVWAVGSLANGATATLHITATVTTANVVSNTATVSASTFDTDPANDSASVDVNARAADLAVTKTVDDSTPNLGGQVVYTVTVTNNGPDDATGVEVSDQLPADLTYVFDDSSGGYDPGTGAWTIGDLANGASATLNITVQVNAATPITNTASITASSLGDPDLANDSADATIDAVVADLAVTKTASNPNPTVGQNVTFTIEVTNNGPDDATGVAVTDLLPAGLTYVSDTSGGSYDDATGLWAVGDLSNGQVTSIDIVATVGTDLPVTNSASVDGDQTDPVPGNDTDDAGIDATQADLAIVKTANTLAPSAPGDAIVFALTLTNNGPDDATGIQVTDLLPAGLTYLGDDGAGSYDDATGIWTVGSLAAGATAVLSVDATIDVATPVTNTATITASDLSDPVVVNNTSSATVDVPDADLSVAKSVDDPTPANIGDAVTYTVTVANAGPDASASATTVDDLLPAGLTFVSDDGAGSYDSVTGVWQVGSVPSGGTRTLTIVATVDTSATVTNTATVQSPRYDPAPGNESDSADVTVDAADLAIDKIASFLAPPVGSTFDYQITVTNTGPNDATGVEVHEHLPAGVVYVSDDGGGSYDPATGVWTIGSLASGASSTLTITVTAATSDPVTNSATVAGDQLDPDMSNNDASVVVDPVEADLMIEKTVDNPNPAVGDTITYTIVATNLGPDVATGVVVIDMFPSGVTMLTANPVESGATVFGTNWDLGALGVGEQRTIEIAALVDDAAGQVNTALITGDQYDPDPADNTAFAAISTPTADLAITKVVDDAAPGAVGDTVNFTIELTNHGPDDAANVLVDDVLPAGLTLVGATPDPGTSYAAGVWDVGSLGAGATVQLAIAATIDTLGPVTNLATATAGTLDPLPGDNTALATVDVPDTDLQVTKTVDVATPPVGTNVTFTVIATNNGPLDATGVTVTDALPVGMTLVSATPSTGAFAGDTWTIGTLSAGGSETMLVVASVDDGAPVTNTASISSDVADSAPANNSAGADVDGRVAGLELTKDVDDAAPARAGDQVTYTLTLTNNGPDTATNAQVTDLLPAGVTYVSSAPSTGTYDSATGVWSVGTLTAGATETLDITVTVDVVTPVVNSAVATSDLVDPTPNTAEVTVDVPEADLGITKTVSDATPAINGTVTYTLTVQNTGPDTAMNVAVDDTLPPGLTFVDARPSTGTWSEPVWTIGTLASGETATLEIDAAVAVSTAVTNTATVSTDTLDANGANDSDSATVDVPDADLSVAKSVDDPSPTIGQTVTFTVVVTNTGPDTATNVAVDDPLPAGLTFVGSAADHGSYTDPTWAIGTLPSGATATLTVQATVTDSAAITNTATVSSSAADPDATNDVAQATVDGPDADLAVSKTVDNPTPGLGDTVTFTVTVVNNGPDTAANVTVDDTLPTGLTIVGSPTTTGGTYDVGAGVWSIGSLADGQSQTLTVDARVDDPAQIVNTATAQSAAADPDLSDNTASATVDVPDADVSVAKSVDDPTPALGHTVTFTVVVANNGPLDADGVTVADQVPAGLTVAPGGITTSTGSYAAGSWTIGHMANGAAETMTVVATVDDANAITNTATVSSTSLDGDPSNDSASATVDVPDADLHLTKTVDDPAPALGGTVTYTVTVTNTGPDTARDVLIADTLPAGLTLISAVPAMDPTPGEWTVGDLASGDTATVTIVATVDITALISNTASVTSTTHDPAPGDESATADVDVPEADLSLGKTVSKSNPRLGEDVVYTVTLTNDGPDAARNVDIADVLPAELDVVSTSMDRGTYDGATWHIGTMPVGSAALTVVARANTETTITNTAEIVVDDTLDPDSVPGDGSGDDIAAATITVLPALADLSLTKSVDTATPIVGDIVTYTLQVNNAGPSIADGVVVSDPIASGFVAASAGQGAYDEATGDWTVGSVPSGGSATLQIQVKIDAAGTHVNTAEIVASDAADPDSTPADADPTQDDYATATLSAVAGVITTPRTRLGISKKGPKVARSGAVVTFTIRVRNAGVNTANDVRIVDCIPGGMSLVRRGGSYRVVRGHLVWRVGALAPGATRTVRVRLRIDPVGRPVRGCAASTFGSNAARVKNAARVRVIGQARVTISPVTG